MARTDRTALGVIRNLGEWKALNASGVGRPTGS
jgi:hypothetical protein